MDDEHREFIVEFCREAIGDPLRSVLAYETVDVDVEPSVLYVREDVQNLYSKPAFEKAVKNVLEDVAMESLTIDWIEHLHSFGDLAGTVRVFEEATVVNCWFDDGGLTLGWDAGAPVDVEPFVKTLRKHAAIPPFMAN